MSAVAAVLANVLLLALLGATAHHLRHRVVLSVLLWGQCLYWFIAYVGRSTLLLSVQPIPRPDDAFADPRLYTESYETSLARVLWTVNLGLSVYLLALHMVVRRFPRGERDQRTNDGRIFNCPAVLGWCTYTSGWAFRVADATHIVTWPLLASVVTSLALFGSLAAGLLLMRTALGETKGRFAVLAATLLVSEFAYSALIGSKAPVVSIVLFSVLGLVLRGWRVRRRLILVGLIAFIGLFPALQSVKADRSAQLGVAAADQYYPALWRPLLPLLRRFDLLSAATDATFYPTGHWLGWGGYLLRIVHGLLPFATPRSWVPYRSAGFSWTAEVRHYSLPNAGLSVSLAEGFIAEGYVWAGVLGVLLLSAAFAVATTLLSRMAVSPRPFWFSMTILLLSQPIVFERGLLGLADAVGQSAQAAVAFLLLWWLLGGGPAPIEVPSASGPSAWPESAISSPTRERGPRELT